MAAVWFCIVLQFKKKILTVYEVDKFQNNCAVSH